MIILLILFVILSLLCVCMVRAGAMSDKYIGPPNGKDGKENVEEET